ncbi:hypothetical protein M9458_046485, partial [Cirrhinus mrigala]
FVRQPDRSGEAQTGIWTKLHPPEKAQDLPSAGVGGITRRHPHHPGDCSHHLPRPVLLSATRTRER